MACFCRKRVRRVYRLPLPAAHSRNRYFVSQTDTEGIAEGTLRNMICAGRIPVVRIGRTVCVRTDGWANSLQVARRLPIMVRNRLPCSIHVQVLAERGSHQCGCYRRHRSKLNSVPSPKFVQSGCTAAPGRQAEGQRGTLKLSRQITGEPGILSVVRRLDEPLAEVFEVWRHDNDLTGHSQDGEPIADSRGPRPRTVPRGRSC